MKLLKITTLLLPLLNGSLSTGRLRYGGNRVVDVYIPGTPGLQLMSHRIMQTTTCRSTCSA